MYHPFFQFVLPRLGQAALDILLYLNFLQLPPLQLVAQWPVLYYGLPLVLMALLAYISRDPLGLGIVFVGHLVTFYCIGTGIGLVPHSAARSRIFSRSPGRNWPTVTHWRRRA